MNIAKFAAKFTFASMLTVLVAGCSFSQILTGVTNAIGIIKGVMYFVSLAPPASDLATFDAAQMTNNLSMNNLSVGASSGTVTISITDQSTNALLGQNTFTFNISSSNQVTFANPTTVNTWVRSFSTYPGYINLDVSGEVPVTPISEQQSGSASAVAMYKSVAVSSGSLTFPAPCTKLPHVTCVVQ